MKFKEQHCTWKKSILLKNKLIYRWKTKGIKRKFEVLPERICNCLMFKRKEKEKKKRNYMPGNVKNWGKKKRPEQLYWCIGNSWISWVSLGPCHHLVIPLLFTYWKWIVWFHTCLYMCFFLSIWRNSLS